jgi:uncharacterized protein
MTQAPAPASGPTALSERALGPDLTRGVMLLFIALANSHYFLRAPAVRGGFPQDTGLLDRTVSWLIAGFVDGRAFPLFGLLFGYGIARIVGRQPGPPRRTRNLLRRRSLALFGIGVAHALLLFPGDILTTYAVLLFFGLWTVRWKDRWLLIVAAGFLLLTLLPADSDLSGSTSALGPDTAMLPPDPGTQLAARMTVWPWIAVLGPIGFAGPFLVGLWAGRRRILEQPERYRRLLIGTAVVGIGVAVAGAQPAALLVGRFIDPPGEAALSFWGPLHDATGALGGFGYAALIALLTARFARPETREGSQWRIFRALAATGQRSMTCYLAQSAVWFVVFTPYLLDLSDQLSVTSTVLVAAAVWLGSVVLADWMGTVGRRGPFETLVRRMTYREAWKSSR